MKLYLIESKNLKEGKPLIGRLVTFPENDLAKVQRLNFVSTVTITSDSKGVVSLATKSIPEKKTT